MDINRCLQVFGLHQDDSLVVIKEQHLAESNFVFSYLLKQTLIELHSPVVMLLTHNSLGHYQCVSKRLGYDLASKVADGLATIVDVQELVAKSLDCLQLDIVAEIRSTLRQRVADARAANKTIYVFVDDVTHLHDLLLDTSASVNVLNDLLSCHQRDQHVAHVVGVHMGDESDKMLSNLVEYSADCIVDVALLRTGRSDDISGVLKVVRNRKLATYHYKVKEYGIDMYKPGEILIR